MKHVLHYALVSALATVMTIATATTLAAPVPSAEPAMNIIEQRNAEADAFVESLAEDIVAKHGMDALQGILVQRLFVIKAMCQGIDPKQLTQMTTAPSASAKAPAKVRIHRETMELHMIKITHPLCMRLTSRPA